MRQPIVFGKYFLLERISVGGMAEVFKAKSFGEEGFEKILAIKRILPSMAEDEEFIEMFIDEAKISGQLSHPNIGQIFELGKIESSYFIAMEYVWGKDVLQIQNRFRRYRQTMPIPMAVFIATRVCEGLDYAHRKKDEAQAPLHIIHRDVSPQNVLVSYTGEVKIIDFGIAKARSRSSKTQAGVLKGKFGYMSPEQVRALPLDQRSDIFSIGTILFEMCTGERLFTGESDFSTLEKVRNAIVPPPSRVNPQITPELEAIILRALKKDPDERYSWATELQEELTAYLMLQSPIFTTKNLCATVSELFSTERVREQSAMEKYRRLRRGDMDSFQAPPSARREMAISLLPQGPPLAVAPAEEDEFEDVATQIGGPAFLREPDPIADAPMLSAEDLVELDEEEEAGPDGQTSIFNDSLGVDQSEPIAAEPTFIFNMESGQMVHVAEQPTIIFANAGGNGGRAVPDLPDQGPTVIFDANLGGISSAAVGPTTGEISGTMPVSVDQRPPSLVKDILIGVLVALLVIMGIVVWRVFTAHQAAPRASTLVLSATPPGSAEVLLDGKSKGRLESGTPFMIEDLPPGSYTVALRVSGVEPEEQAVKLSEGQVLVLSLPLPKPAAKAHLVLSVDPPDARVLIDGVEVSMGAARAPLEVKSEVVHDVRVEKEGFEPEIFKVTLGPSEKLERTVKLKPQVPPVQLKVITRPSGAQVQIDGEARGTTPVTIELRPGTYRVKVILEGYRAQSESVELAPDKKALVSLVLKREAAQKPPVEPVTKKPPVERTTRKPPVERTTRKPPVERTTRKPPVEQTTRKPPVEVTPPPESANVGYLVANTIPWAKVFVDGKDTGKTTPVAPRSKIPLKPGRHKITFVVEGKQYDFAITVEAGKITRLIKKLPVD